MDDRASEPDFSALHAAMKRWVDAGLLPGVSVAVLIGRDRVHTHCVGFADRERAIALDADHLFRVYSNSKLVTSCAVLALHEDGRFDLDEPVQRYLPALANRHVLRPGARNIDDTEPARRPITIRHLLTHTSGLSYGLFDPGTPLFKAYAERRINDSGITLEQMVDALAPLPLAFEPGEGWEYSVATDVLSRLVEVCSGKRFDAFLDERVFQPLNMRDTGFFVPASRHDRLAALYAGADLANPMKPGLTRAEHLLPPGAHLQPRPRLSGGGGLVSSLADTVALLRALMPDGPTLLKPTTIASMAANQLPAGRFIQFSGMGVLAGKGHGLAAGVVVTPAAHDHPDSAGEIGWSGLAGTQWWIAPRHRLAGVLMTQRWYGNAHPFAADLKREVYRAVLER